MAQNTSNAVMASRVEAHDSLDDFPTPSWATRALVKHVIMPRLNVFDPASYLKKCYVWEPACNRGFMTRPLAESFGHVIATDIHDYGWLGQQVQHDFLFPSLPDCAKRSHIDFVISNPPFRLAEQFIARSFEVANTWHGTAMLVRTAFLESAGRYENLFKLNPPSVIAQFVERVPMFKGRVDPAGSTATAYCWLLWLEGEEGTTFTWIPPCRKALERPGDYEAAV